MTTRTVFPTRLRSLIRFRNGAFEGSPRVWLFQSVGAGFGADAVVVARVARDADGSDDLAVHDDRDSAFDWNSSFQTQHADARATARNGILKRLRRAFEAHGRAGLADGHLRAS